MSGRSRKAKGQKRAESDALANRARRAMSRQKSLGQTQNAGFQSAQSLNARRRRASEQSQDAPNARGRSRDENDRSARAERRRAPEPAPCNGELHSIAGRSPTRGRRSQGLAALLTSSDITASGARKVTLQLRAVAQIDLLFGLSRAMLLHAMNARGKYQDSKLRRVNSLKI